MMVHRYSPNAVPVQGPGAREDEPAFPVPPVPDAIVPGAHYVVAEVLFAAPAQTGAEVNWRAFLEPETGAVLYLQSGSSAATGQVYLVDPFTGARYIADYVSMIAPATSYMADILGG